MEFPIKVMVIFILTLIAAFIIMVLIGIFSGQSGDLIEQIFGFFRNLFNVMPS